MYIKKVGIFTLLFILLFNSTRVYGGGSYRLNLNVGEYTSNLSQNLTLDTSQKWGDYRIKGSINFFNYYRIRMGQWDDGLWDIGDYSFGVINKEKELHLGHVNISSPSRFVSIGQIEGINLKNGGLDLWIGDLRRSGAGFSSGSNKEQVGLSYKGDIGTIAYLIEEDYDYRRREERSNHYITYNNYFSLGNSYLSVDNSIGFNLDEEDLGWAGQLNYNSNIKGLNYNLGARYRSPSFHSLNSLGGYGDYKLSLRTYKGFSSYYIENSINYDEDNLTRDLNYTRRNLSNNFRLRYFNGSGGSYTFNIFYKMNKSYDIANDETAWSNEDNSFSLAYERDRLDYRLVWRENSIRAAGSYDLDRSTLSGSYNWDLRKGRSNKGEVSLDYGRKIFNSLDYNIDTSLEYEDEFYLTTRQRANFSIGDNHTLNGTLSLNRPLTSDGRWFKRFSFGYKINF
ncbi:hypothetical protein [Halonatronum saccharophilum]|uniref:hypothetical protein n=1 Tax=Halonatronum saccharophilum TaxID=150060 RepID=UPI000488203D|nr:hypothetical protein [Halonatronum saccharophilum]